MAADFRSRRVSIRKRREPTAYMDETGHSDDPRFHFAGMAGFVAPAKLWKVLGKYWEKVLSMFHLTEPFHMKDFAHSQGQFKDWKGKEEKRKSLYGKLIEGIVAAELKPVGAIVSIEGFRSLSDRQQKSLLDPYYVAFQRCTRGATGVGMFGEPQEKVAMVYSYNEEYGATKPQKEYSVDQAGRAEQLWHAMKKNTDFGPWMGSYASNTPRELVQLQIADLFAYELAKEFENLLKRPDDKMRWGLRQILKKSHFQTAMISLMDRLELLRIIKESNMQFQEGTEEIGDPFKQMNSVRQKMTKWMEDRVGSQDLQDSEI